jgi:L-iditol 2-dehydrogenase
MLATSACGICATDLKSIAKGAAKPEYALGHEVVGKVIEAGEQSGWSIGQRAVVAPYLPCGACHYCLNGQPTLCKHLFDTCPFPGGMAEKVFVPGDLVKRGLIPVSDSLADEYAALAEPLGCVIKGIEDSQVKTGDSVLVIGDGPMGLMAAAVARAYGAFPVMVAGMTPSRLEAAQHSFADIVLDVTQVDLEAEVKKITAGRGADVVIAAVSAGETLMTAIQCVRPGGMVNAFAGTPEGTTIPLDLRKLHYNQIHLTGSFGTAPEHMVKALHLLEYKKLPAEAIVTACFPFSRIQEAVDYALQRQGLKTVVTF